MPASPLTPVTLLAGASGSGKTTLLERARRDSGLGNVAVIACAAPSSLNWSAPAETSGLASSCLCCYTGGELIGTLRELYYRRAAGTMPFFQRVVIEASGHTDLQRIAAMLAELPLASARYALDGIVTVVDAERGERALDDMAKRQIVQADLLAIAKADRTTGPKIAALEDLLAEWNPHARRIMTQGAEFDPASVFGRSIRPKQVRAT